MSTRLPLTAARTAALSIGVPLSLLLIISAAYSSVTTPGISGGGTDHPTARLELSAQGSTVTAGANYGTLEVARAAGGLRLAWTVRYTQHHPTVTWNSAPSRVTQSSDCQAVADCTFSYRASLPSGRPAVISDGAGTVRVTGLSSPVTVTTRAGSIVATALSGTVHLRAQAGDITGDRLTGPVTQAAAQAGDIKLTGLSSPVVTVSEQSGDMALAFAGVPARVSADSQMGAIRVMLPRGPTRYWVIVNTDFGQTSVTVPTSEGSPHVVRASTQFGAISVAP